MKYIEAPNDFDLNGREGIFLAGGITNCPDWQKEMTTLLNGIYATLLNPRRANFPIGNPNAAKVQIKWEHDALRRAHSILFWFPCETLCPIVLYELGAWSMTSKPIYVGVHPKYERRQDVKIQTSLVRPEVSIVYSLDALAGQVIADY
jgi:hypothetical protein